MLLLYVPIAHVGVLFTYVRGYKTCFMLSLAEDVILNAHMYKKYQEIKHFSGLDKPRMLFFLLIKVEMPTNVCIFTLMSRKNFMLN